MKQLESIKFLSNKTKLWSTTSYLHFSESFSTLHFLCLKNKNNQHKWLCSKGVQTKGPIKERWLMEVHPGEQATSTSAPPAEDAAVWAPNRSFLFFSFSSSSTFIKQDNRLVTKQDYAGGLRWRKTNSSDTVQWSPFERWKRRSCQTARLSSSAGPHSPSRQTQHFVIHKSFIERIKGFKNIKLF